MIKKLTFALVAMAISVTTYAQSKFEWKEASVAMVTNTNM
jgi:hypothetical protein